MNKRIFTHGVALTTTALAMTGGSALAQDDWTSQAIAPVTNPIFFETPMVQSEIRPIFAYHTLDDDFLNADVNVKLYAVQVRYAVNDRLAIIATKDGYLDIGGDVKEDGWADLAAGVKYAVVKNDDSQFIVTPGLTFEIPIGDDEVFQGNGDGEFNVFVSAMKGWDKLHLNLHVGGRFPIDHDEETMNVRYSAMVDYYTCRWFIPFAAINAFTTLSEGSGPGFQSEGFDVINFGSSDAKGETQAAWGVGFRSRILPSLDIGFAYENGFAPDDDIFNDRFTVDAIWRF